MTGNIDSGGSFPLGATQLVWHGVELNTPDWGPHSHSLAGTVRGPRLNAVLHLMLNAYWEPLDFEVPLAPEGPQGPWSLWIDTSRPSPHDICGWQQRCPVKTSRYRVEARSLAVLIVHPTHRDPSAKE